MIASRTRTHRTLTVQRDDAVADGGVLRVVAWRRSSGRSGPRARGGPRSSGSSPAVARQLVAAVGAAGATSTRPASRRLIDELLEVGAREVLLRGDLGEARRALSRSAARAGPSAGRRTRPSCEKATAPRAVERGPGGWAWVAAWVRGGSSIPSDFVGIECRANGSGGSTEGSGAAAAAHRGPRLRIHENAYRARIRLARGFAAAARARSALRHITGTDETRTKARVRRRSGPDKRSRNIRVFLTLPVTSAGHHAPMDPYPPEALLADYPGPMQDIAAVAPGDRPPHDPRRHRTRPTRLAADRLRRPGRAREAVLRVRHPGTGARPPRIRARHPHADPDGVLQGAHLRLRKVRFLTFETIDEVDEARLCPARPRGGPRRDALEGRTTASRRVR